MRVLVLLVCIFAVLVCCQPQRPGDCYQIETVEKCVETNPPPNLPMNTVSVNCLWCHSHSHGSKARSHCAPLQHIQTNPDYQNGWVCDYRMPRNKHHVGTGDKYVHSVFPRDNQHRSNGNKHHGVANMGKHHKPNANNNHANNNKHRTNKNKHGRHLLDVYSATGLADMLEMSVNAYGPFGQFVAALIYGAVGDVPVDLANCLANSALTLEGLNATAHNLTWNSDVTNSVTNIATLYNSIQQTLFNAIGDCARVGFDVSQLVLPVASVALSITKDVIGIVNGFENKDGGAIGSGFVGLFDLGVEIAQKLTAPNIEQDVSSGFNALQSGQFFTAGLQFGHAIFTGLITL